VFSPTIAGLVPFQAGAVTSSGPASGSSSRSGSIYSNQLEQRMFDNAAMHSQQHATGGLQADTAAKAAAATVAAAAAAAALAGAASTTNTGSGSKPQSTGAAGQRSSTSGGSSSSGLRVPISTQLIELAEALKGEEAACKQRSQQLEAERARSVVAEEKAAAMGRELDIERRRAKVSCYT
jgi:hypothetical protein